MAKPEKNAKTATPKDKTPKTPKGEAPKTGKIPRDKVPIKEAGPRAPLPEGYVPRLKRHYDEAVRAELLKEFGYKNAMEVPRLTKIVLNMGVGEATADTKKVQAAAADLAVIAGQRPIITRARKSIAVFKVREHMPIGCKVTLRRQEMYEFLDRLVTIALPRVRDFRGVPSKSFDGRGNYALGIKEHIIFPEIDYDKVSSVWGMDVVICTTAKTDAEAKALLKAFNFPFMA